MKFLAFATLFTLASAHDLRARHPKHLKRQSPALSSSSPAVTGSSSAPGAATSASASSASSGSAPISGVSSSTPTSTVPQTTPFGPGTDIPPLSSITLGAAPEATATPSTTFAEGAVPTYIDGAPPLPSPFVFIAADWPPQDRVPPTDSDEVTEWLKELDGFDIPDLDPTTDGTCANNPAASLDAANRGWWTCGGYTRDTDVVSCPDKLTWGVSFDDGPSPYTQKLLRYLDEKDIQATFFVVGSRVIERPVVLIEEYMSGHEISVHTWSHRPLTSLTNEQIVAELGWTRQAIQNVLGVTPTTMRPPYGDIDDRVRAISLAMGMVPIIWTRGPTGLQFDTNDWRIVGGGVTGPQSFQSFEYILGNTTLIDTGFIVLQHDLFQQTVDMAVGYTLNQALSYDPKLTLMPIGLCQGWSAADIYLETTTNTTFPYLNSTATTIATTTASERAAAASTAAAANNNGSGSGGSTTSSAGLSAPLPALAVLSFALVGGLFVL